MDTSGFFKCVFVDDETEHLCEHEICAGELQVRYFGRKTGGLP